MTRSLSERFLAGPRVCYRAAVDVALAPDADARPGRRIGRLEKALALLSCQVVDQTPVVFWTGMAKMRVTCSSASR